jgi:putative spermidine/putrescine transport system permease protein
MSTSADTAVRDQRRGGFPARMSAALFRRPRLKLALLLGPPVTWMVIVYLVSLAFLLATAFWRLNVLTSEVERVFTLQNFQTLAEDSVYRTITLRTLGMAAAVTITDLILAVPIAYYAARMASPRLRPILLFAVVMPLWSNYLVRVFAWKTITAGNGPLDSLLGVLGIDVSLTFSNWAVWLTFSYLWLPYAILPIYAAFERVPESLLEASSDLGARHGRTFRRVVVPLVFPGLVAASIFTFSLTLGDYITPVLVGKGFFIGNAIFNLVGVASNLPLAAAFATVPMVIMALYLAIARRFGAFEAM